MVQPSAKARDSAEAKRRRPRRGEDEGRIIPAASTKQQPRKGLSPKKKPRKAKNRFQLASYIGANIFF